MEECHCHACEPVRRSRHGRRCMSYCIALLACGLACYWALATDVHRRAAPLFWVQPERRPCATIGERFYCQEKWHWQRALCRKYSQVAVGHRVQQLVCAQLSDRHVSGRNLTRARPHSRIRAGRCLRQTGAFVHHGDGYSAARREFANPVARTSHRRQLRALQPGS